LGGYSLAVTDVQAAVAAVAQKTAGAITRRNLSIQGMRGVAALFVYFFTHQSIPAGTLVNLVGRQLSTAGSVSSALLSFSRSLACLCQTLSSGVTPGDSLHIGSSEYIHCISLP
jgi:hypothetical protein